MRRADRPLARSRLKRRAFPIAAYVGPNGTGKSAVMVYDTLPSLEAGRPVLSTVRLLDYRDPHLCGERTWDVCDDPANHDLQATTLVADPDSPGGWRQVTSALGLVHRASHPLYVRFTDYAQLLAWRNGDVLMDEVTGVASSREVSSMPVQVANYLVQLRRRNVALRWSAPAWGRADKIIREVTQGVTLTSAFLSARAKVHEGQAPQLWLQRKIIVARTYDAQAFDEFEAHRADKLKSSAFAAYWGPGSRMFTAYDTYEPVTSLGWANDAGLCMNCGGKRAHAKCGCPDHKPVRTPAPTRSAEVTS